MNLSERLDNIDCYDIDCYIYETVQYLNEAFMDTVKKGAIGGGIGGAVLGGGAGSLLGGGVGTINNIRRNYKDAKSRGEKITFKQARQGSLKAGLKGAAKGGIAGGVAGGVVGAGTGAVGGAVAHGTGKAAQGLWKTAGKLIDKSKDKMM